MASKFRRPAVRFTFGTALQRNTDFQTGDSKGHDGGRDSGAPSPDTTPSVQPATVRLLYNQQRIKLLDKIAEVLHERAELESSFNTFIILHDELKKKLARKTEECIAAKKVHLNDARANAKYLEKEKEQVVAQIERINAHLREHAAEHEQHLKNADDSSEALEPKATPVKTIAKNDKQPSRKADQKLAAARLLREVQQLRNRLAALERRLVAEARRKKQAEDELAILKAALLRQKGKRLDK